MKKAYIAAEIVILLVLANYSYFLATDFQTAHGRHDMPFFVWVIQTIDLFIHEGGHGVFKIFGQFIYFLGGSLMQVILPVTAIVVLLRTSGPRTLLATLYWLGQNLIDVSIYIDDAPKQQLTLISRHAMHDWRWLCGYMGNLDSAEDIAAVVSFLGTMALVTALGFGAYYVFVDIRDEYFPSVGHKPTPPLLRVKPKPPIQPTPPDHSTKENAL